MLSSVLQTSLKFPIVFHPISLLKSIILYLNIEVVCQIHKKKNPSQNYFFLFVMTILCSLSFFYCLLLFLSAHACPCPSTTSLKSAYFHPDTERVVKATPVDTAVVNGKRVYTLQIELEYKACGPTPTEISVSTNLTPQTCGVTLESTKSYVLVLDSLNDANISLCDVSFLILLLSRIFLQGRL